MTPWDVYELMVQRGYTQEGSERKPNPDTVKAENVPENKVIEKIAEEEKKVESEERKKAIVKGTTDGIEKLEEGGKELVKEMKDKLENGSRMNMSIQFTTICISIVVATIFSFFVYLTH